MTEQDGYQVGDILEGSWGYDQTNIDFYRVVKRTDKTVWMRKMQTRHVSDAGFMSDHVEPGDDIETAGLMRRKLHHDQDGRIMGCAFQPSYGWISAWRGGVALRTSYA